MPTLSGPVVPVGPDWVLPAVPLLPDWVSPVVLAFPGSPAGLEFDVVAEPGCPQLAESPEEVTEFAVAVPATVEAIEPVLTETAVAVTVTAEPVAPVLPETAGGVPESIAPVFPEFPDVASPLELADPVFPGLALPDEAVVSFSLVEVAAPEVPPMVVPVAVELPLSPDVAAAVEPSEAFPVLPEPAVPLALPDWDDPEPLDPEPSLPWPPHWLPEPLFEPVFADPDFGLA